MMNRRHESGGASLFVVIFVTIIITIITVSFTALMIKNQQQSSANDLSDRAYDSAMAGVEDAKRVLVAAKTACAPGGNATTCTTLTNLLSTSASSQNCATPYVAGITAGAKRDSNGKYAETQVGSSASDNQAYTCVTVDMTSSNYQDSLSVDEPTVIPLVGTGPFNKVKLTWFTRDDATAAGQISTTDNTVHYYNGTDTTTNLPQSASWGTNGSAPSLLRAQYIPGTGNASTLDTSARTLFLYPKKNVGVSTANFTLDNRSGTGSTSPVLANCPNYSSNINGACSITLILPGAPTSNAYLQLTPLYNATHVTVELLSASGTTVNFNGVQPIVDSTGRASDLFRRVSARVKVSNVSLPYPDGAVDVSGNLCKTFSLSDNNGNSYNSGGCTP